LNTAEALQAITDRGKFELLVMPILRHSDKDYQAIIHTGVNAAGETIKSPLDAFCLVPKSNPPHYIMVECTTTDISSLKNKWLSEGTSCGDLMKANICAKKLKKENPDAEFTIILVTNEQLKGHTLYTETMNKADQLGLTCDIWEQSRLRDFLDTTPEGHWLRKEHLFIAAEMLSASLLSNLCKQNLRLYAEDLFADTNNFVCRNEGNLLNKSICSDYYSLQLIIGESGFGKSVIAYKSLEQFINDGGYGLWIPAEFHEDCLTTENCIEKMLKKLHPTLLDGAAKYIFQIITESNKNSKFIIVIDDIHQARDTSRCLQKVIALSKPQTDDSTNSKQESSPYTFICPTWPQDYLSIDKEIRGKPWANTTFVNAMNAPEGKTIITNAVLALGKNISDTEATSLSAKMGNDPIILGLFTTLITTAQISNLNTLSDNVIEQFIDKEIDSIVNKQKTYLSSEYHDVLSDICRYMLVEKKLYPSWDEILNWAKINSIEIDSLRELVHHSKLCRLNNNKLVFRHDRIQESLLVKTMRLILDTQEITSEALLVDPFFSKIIGKALLQISENDKVAEFLKNHNILAIFEAIRCIGIPVSNFHRTIINKANEWSNEKVANDHVTNSELGAICWTLIETDSPEILEITDNFPKWPLLLLARLRNGDILSGVLYCKNRRHFEPMVNNKLRDQVIEKVKSQYGEKLRTNLRQLLQSSSINDETRTGALIMAGFSGDNQLKDDILICWNNITIKTDFIEEAIWAASQCCANEPNKHLNSLMQCWEALPDGKDSDFPPKNRIAENLRFALRKRAPNNIIKYFITCCESYEPLRWPITYMMHQIDDPDSIEFIIRDAADTERRLAGTDKFSFWTTSLTDPWNKRLNRGQRLSENSLSRLRILWKNSSNDDEYLRKQAFRLWLTAAETKDIDTLKSTSDKALLKSALLKRIELGDYSAVKDFMPILIEDPYLFRIAHHVWCEELIKPAEQLLEKFKCNIPKDFSGGRLNPHYFLSRFLIMIPDKGAAEELLDKYWEHLQYSGLFIQAALYIGTPRRAVQC